MVGGQGEQDPVNEQNVLEVVDDALAVQEVHGSAQEVPVQRLGEAQAAGLAWDVGYGNHLLEADDLDGGNDDDDVQVAGAEGKEEAADHDQRPCCADDEVCLFLLILALLGDLWSLETSAGSFSSKRASVRTGGFSAAPLRVGLPGCEPVSLMSDMLIEARRARPLLALLCANLTSLRGRVMAVLRCSGAVRKNWSRRAGAYKGKGSAAGQRARRGVGLACPSCKSNADQKRCNGDVIASTQQIDVSISALAVRLHVKLALPPPPTVKHATRPSWQCTLVMHVGGLVGKWRCSNVRRRVRLLRP